MKKLIILMISVLLFVTLIPIQAKTKHMGFSTQGSLKNITISWTKKKNVQYYKVYRKKVTKIVENETYNFPKEKKYKKIAKVTGKKYIDKKVKKNNYYAYIVKGFKKVNGKEKLLYTSYFEDDLTYEYCGLVKPDLFNGGYGENFTNSRSKLYIFVQVNNGATPGKFLVYRKASHEKKYKKITLKVVEGKNKNDTTVSFLDNTVKSGETYSYKVRSYKKSGNKKYYSKYSDVLTLPAVNFSAQLKVEKISSTESELIYKLTSKKYNGNLTILDKGYDENMFMINKNKKQYYFEAKLSEYSTDGSVYNTLPTKGFVLKENQTVYLKYQLSETDVQSTNEKDNQGYFSSENGSLKYNGPGSGETFMYLDFDKKSGYAYLEWD